MSEIKKKKKKEVESLVKLHISIISAIVKSTLRGIAALVRLYKSSFPDNFTPFSDMLIVFFFSLVKYDKKKRMTNTQVTKIYLFSAWRL